MIKVTCVRPCVSCHRQPRISCLDLTSCLRSYFAPQPNQRHYTATSSHSDFFEIPPNVSKLLHCQRTCPPFNTCPWPPRERATSPNSSTPSLSALSPCIFSGSAAPQRRTGGISLPVFRYWVNSRLDSARVTPSPMRRSLACAGSPKRSAKPPNPERTSGGAKSCSEGRKAGRNVKGRKRWNAEN